GARGAATRDRHRACPRAARPRPQETGRPRSSATGWDRRPARLLSMCRYVAAGPALGQLGMLATTGKVFHTSDSATCPYGRWQPGSGTINTVSRALQLTVYPLRSCNFSTLWAIDVTAKVGLTIC